MRIGTAIALIDGTTASLVNVSIIIDMIRNLPERCKSIPLPPQLRNPLQFELYGKIGEIPELDIGAHRVALRRQGIPLDPVGPRSEEHTSELQSHVNLVCRL